MEVGTRGELERIGRAVKQVQWQHHRSLDRRLRLLGASLVQWDVLRALDADPKASAHDLAIATFQSDQALGTLARRMEAKGYIARSVSRGRRFEHLITDRGREILEAGHVIAADTFAGTFGELTEAERSQLLQLLERLARAGTDR